MVKVYGASDDLVEIEGSTYEDDEIGCWDRDVLIDFVDGTRIRVHYGKPGLGVWAIMVEKQGTAPQILTECSDEDADIYSDVFEIDAEVRRHKVVEEMKNG
uniref:Uncharacterized protein n=1 Tax=Myoviridae sp. ctr0w28 TaxID=2826703 RepID=A0A8S5NQJ7_9CAUD|nr:MAG TPA: hypothetical protein [Myoviridae sp. ctr0w28]